MLNKVTLTNFQSHKNLVVDCGKFTTLTGGSNGGKSAVLRAILALVKNDSVGDYVRYGQKTLSVKLEFDDCTVEWKKGEGTNTYILTKDGKESVFDKVGSGVPDEIAEVLRLGPITLKGSTQDKEYVNFHSQLEAPFIISSTPPKVAKLFGELTSASQLYSAVNEGNKRVRSTNSLKTTRMTDIQAAREALDEFSDLDAQVTHLETSKALLDSASALDTDIATLTNSLESINRGLEKEKELEATLVAVSSVAEYSLDELTSVYEKCTELETLVESITDLDNKIRAWDNNKGALESAADADLAQLAEIQGELEKIESLTSKISEADRRVADLEKLVNSAERDVVALDKEIDEFIDTLDSCPECGEILSDEKKAELREGRLTHAAS